MSALLQAIALLTAFGLLLLSRLVLEDVRQVLAALQQRWQRRTHWLQRQAAPTAALANGPDLINAVWRTPIGLGAVGGVAVGSLWWSNPLLALWFVIFGGGIGWLITLNRPSQQEDLRALELFVGTLRSVFGVGQSVFAALAHTTEYLEAGPLRQALEETTRQYRADLDSHAALSKLTALRWPHLDRLVIVLDQVGQADERTVRDTLTDLEQRLRVAGRVRDRANTVLVLSRLTLRVLQAINLVALVMVTVLPTWRTFYLDNPLALIGVTALGLVSSAYFAGELNRLATAI